MTAGNGPSSIPACRSTTPGGLARIFADKLAGQPVTRIIVTHMHPDHVGNAGWISRKFPGARLHMSRLEYITCRMLVADTGRQAPPEGTDFYSRAGWDESAIENYRKRFGGFGRGVSAMPEAYVRLQDGDTLEMGGQTWRVVTGHGHSPEHACLYCPGLGLLISGDQLLPRISSNVSVFPTEPEANPLADWMDSCAKLIDAVHLMMCLSCRRIMNPSRCAQAAASPDRRARGCA